MLVLTRYVGERIRLKTPAGEVVWVTVTECDRGKVRLAIDAPLSVEIMREELLPPSEYYPSA